MSSYIKTSLLAIAALLLLGISSCMVDDEPTGSGALVAPTVRTITAHPGEEVSIELAVQTTAGFSSLQYSVNGGDLLNVSVAVNNPTAEFTIPFLYIVPAEAFQGDIYELEFYVTDENNILSNAAPLTINVGPRIDFPATYSFERDGVSTVSYSGQTDRLNQVAEIKAYLATANDGATTLSSATLYAMYINTNGNGGGNFSFTSDRQLADKTFAPDVSFYETLFDDAQAASEAAVAGATATQGNAGLIARSNGNNILVDGQGHEFTQIWEKGVMGAIFLNQIYNVYMTDGRVGDEVNNIDLVTDKNYTAMEHHWDEAFGYFGVPVDFPVDFPGAGTDEDRFWAEYTNGRDALLNVNNNLMGAYIDGRTGIVNRDYNTRDASRETIYATHELVAAATAIHYLNAAQTALNNAEVGDFFHLMSEAYMFVNALRYSPVKALSNEEINTILNTNLGTDGDFWTITNEGINTARNTIAAAYPELTSIAGSL